MLPQQSGTARMAAKAACSGPLLSNRSINCLSSLRGSSRPCSRGMPPAPNTMVAPMAPQVSPCRHHTAATTLAHVGSTAVLELEPPATAGATTMGTNVAHSQESAQPYFKNQVEARTPAVWDFHLAELVGHLVLPEDSEDEDEDQDGSSSSSYARNSGGSNSSTTTPLAGSSSHSLPAQPSVVKPFYPPGLMHNHVSTLSSTDDFQVPTHVIEQHHMPHHLPSTSSTHNATTGTVSISSAGAEQSVELPRQGYRTADSVALLRVPRVFDTLGQVSTSDLLVAKECIFMHGGEMDSFKYCSASNEWSTFIKHSLQHTNLVQLLGYTKSRTAIHVMSEYCNGGDVQSLLDRYRHRFGTGLTEEQVRSIAKDVLEGLAHMHDAGVVHGDIKPSNVWIHHNNNQGHQGHSSSSSSAPGSAKDLTLHAATAHLQATDAAPVHVSHASPAEGHLALAHAAEPTIPTHAASPPTPTTTFTTTITTTVTGTNTTMTIQTMANTSNTPAASTSASSLVKRMASAMPRRRRVTYKLGDFGTSRELGRQHLHYFVSGFGFTPEYASPETLRHGTGKVGTGSDVWSFGIMLMELLLGELPPVSVEFKRLHEAAQWHQNWQRDRYLHQHSPWASLPVHWSAELQELVAACLQADGKNRPQTAGQLLKFSWFQ